jgi:transposase-like protein
VPRTCRFSPTAVIRGYVRPEAEIDRVILAGFVLGLSTRKVGEAPLAILGQKVSATTVSQVAKTLDQVVAAFHRRPLKNGYKALMLDGVVLAGKTGAGALKSPVLVALGLRSDSKEGGRRPPPSGQRKRRRVERSSPISSAAASRARRWT